jgi:hypothetical protein
MTNLLFMIRTAILLGLFAASFAEWKRARLFEEIIALKDARIQAMEQAGLAQSTTNTILQAGMATSGTFQIHTPPEGCPPGWTEVKDLFSESDGSMRSGCVLRKSDGELGHFHTDYLLPGESTQVHVIIEPFRMPGPMHNL